MDDQKNPTDAGVWASKGDAGLEASRSEAELEDVELSEHATADVSGGLNPQPLPPGIQRA